MRDLLVAAVLRGGEQRRAATARALENATGPRGSLDALLRSYTEFSLDQRHLIGVLVGELDQPGCGRFLPSAATVRR
nr:hypothetical protein OG781_06305 [Streptomyces sp. NBC_00830]